VTGIDWTRWQILSPLLDDLLELDPACRADRLAELRRGDPRLAGELDALLAEEVAVERDAFLEGSALAGEATLTGRIVGSYTLDTPLGQGGMGSVWLAHRSDGRFAGRVAVKFLNLALVARSGAERFRREGSILAKLAHPNIARLLDAGVADGGQPYLVLELVEGQPIDRYCEALDLATEARLRLFLDVLAAVEYAHRNLILHRDLKPSNILVTNDGQVKLLDFGIAKLLGEPAEATALTRLAGRAFTPEYAAPEQVQGKEVTTATDVYALGVLLYLLLTGGHPTAVPTQTPVEQLRAVVETEPDRLSTAVARMTKSGADASLALHTDRSRSARARALRGDLDTIAAKALKKSPHERYATVATFADDLHRYLNHEPVSARPDSRAYRIGKFVRRHRLGVGAASATLLALIVGVIGTTWQAFEARRERDAALFQAERAVAKGNFVNLLLGAIGGGDRPLTQREILGRSVDLVEKQFGTRPRIAIDLLLPIAGNYMTLGDVEKELDAMQRAARHAAVLGDPDVIADVACNTADTQVRRNRLDLARMHLETGFSRLAELAKPHPGTVIACLRGEIELARATGDLDRAIERTREGLALAERTGRTKDSTYPMLLSYLQGLHRDRGELAASLEVLRRMQRLDEEMGRTDTVDYLSGRASEARILVDWGEYRAAWLIVDSLLPRWRESTADGEPTPWFDTLRGDLLLRFEDWPGAQRVLASAAERSRSQGSVDVAFASEFVLARALLATGRRDEATRLLARIEAERPPVPGRYKTITPAAVRAQLTLAQGSATDAARMIQGELARMGYPGAKDSIPLAAALRVAAQVYLALGEGSRAEGYARAATEIAERLARDPTASAHVGEAMLLLARAQRLQHKDAESAATARRAVPILAAACGDDHRLTRDAQDLTGH
jgi:serine/threonine protein kinase/tetratricopeptide (TPR) repeat protein